VIGHEDHRVGTGEFAGGQFHTIDAPIDWVSTHVRVVDAHMGP
jgi:hypothetical protein